MSILPAEEEFADLVPGPDSPVRRYASDIRLVATAGYALLLQVAHPVVGAGVAEHSNFQEDPWGRLHRTLDYVNGTIYGGPELAGEIGRRVRDMHKDIKGVRPDGERYHALEPGPYAWVHATLASAVIHGHERFGRPLAPSEKDRYWQDWLKVGRLIGVRERDLPAEWGDFDAYFTEVCDTQLVSNPTIGVVLDTLRRPARPLKQIPRPVWRALRYPAARYMLTSTVGLLRPQTREQLNLPWTAANERAFRAISAASRATTPVLIPPLRQFGPVYVKLRAKPLARGDVARRSGGPTRAQEPAVPA
jgi:uncharacterized protein (DUF2236 family)